MAEGARLLSEYRKYSYRGFKSRPLRHQGGVAEWLKAAVLKTVVGTSPPWVRILPPPPSVFAIVKVFLFFLSLYKFIASATLFLLSLQAPVYSILLPLLAAEGRGSLSYEQRLRLLRLRSQ